MNEVSFVKLWFRWSLVFSILITLGWSLYTLIGFSLPHAWWFGLDRRWDILAPPIIFAGIFFAAQFMDSRYDIPAFLTAVGAGTFGVVGVFVGSALGAVLGIVTAYLLAAVSFLGLYLVSLLERIQLGPKKNVLEWLQGA